jgi:hypothetical protein
MIERVIMNETARTYIFHLFRADGKSLILHPFQSADKLASALEQTQVLGRYGRDPSVESLTEFREEVYRLIDAAVKRRIADARFIPRFVLSAAAFLVTYFFFSVIVHDPIPVLNGFLSVAAAIACFVLLGRRYSRSDAAAKKRRELTELADRVLFTESGFIRAVEDSLHVNECRSVEEITTEILAPSLQELGPAEREETEQLLSLLEGILDPRNLKRGERVIRKLGANPAPRQGAGGLAELVGSRAMDLPLYAVYRAVKKSVAGPRT